MKRLCLTVVGVAAPVLCGGTAAAQVRFDDVSFNMGVASQLYHGDFSAVTVPQIDSTERALAGAGYMGARGTLTLLAQDRQSLRLDFDAGMRQFVTNGFQLRNYAPRELSGSLRSTYTRRYRGGTLRVVPTVESRYIADRPPMPLYLPPGYNSAAVDANYSRAISPGLAVYGRVVGELKDYAAPRVLPALDLLDRRTITPSAGVTLLFRGFSETLDRTTVTFFAAYQYHSYPKQGGLGLPRADDGLQAGSEFTLDRREAHGFVLTLSGNATRNRSSSRRVEYNAGRIRTTAAVELGDDTQLDIAALWAVKRYIHPQEALVPGEEADNAASVNAEITRFLGDGVRAGIGGGWIRAETNFSGDYYERFSVSFSLTVNPRF